MIRPGAAPTALAEGMSSRSLRDETSPLTILPQCVQPVIPSSGMMAVKLGPMVTRMASASRMNGIANCTSNSA